MITRRDFLNGVSLTIAAGLAPIDLVRAEQLVPGALAADYYPPALTGLRGSHPGSFEPAHGLAREGSKFAFDAVPVEEDYDLAIVGGGISGLSAAWFYREKHGADKKILILDNHDDFGGHAKRNEFRAGDRLILGYGGTESMESPRTGYSKVASSLLKSLAIDIDRFTTAFDRTFYHSHKLSRGVFFDKDNWGRDKLVTGDPSWLMDDDQLPDKLNARPIKQFVNDFPLSAKDKAALIAFYAKPKDYLKGKSKDEKKEYLAKTSYRDFLLKNVKLSEKAAMYFQGRFNDLYASCSDTVSALTAMETGFPGFAGLKIAEEDGASKDSEDPYICHFPDGNASIARLLVRSLIPAVAVGNTMDDVVLAKFDYSKLDTSASPVRIRLNSIGLNVANVKDGVDVTYINAGKLHKVRAKKTILAGWNMLIPFIAPEIPEEQKLALRQNVKLPLIYTNVIIRNWHPFVKLGVHDIYSPTMPYARIKMDYPVSLGDYRFPKTPDEPMCVHMYCALTSPNQGMDTRTQAQIGRQFLLETPYEKLEHTVRDQLSRMLAGSGFDEGRDIQGITVNRWPHGYSYSKNELFEESDAMETTIALARKPFGNVAIANADAGWEPLTQSAIDQAWRAVNELA
ncbi:NAD(P)-binding protein [Microvirga alba]|uniref:NAD(P)/FAD-dependent oxidoreductase n=1 Tax=Microvirga alba TaxID=2791025 RepID=A0A931FLZ9_9HYPH|nr:FAD/NAD(P)-binding protein [Microvirga alba]MBF9232594.1 NAD(P)/FAD-dependent oxidoreductase [Microvirga alba]